MSSSSASHHHTLNQPHVERSHHPNSGGNSVSSVAKSLLPTRRRLKLDPANKLYFPYESDKQVRSAIRIKNTNKSQVAFKEASLFDTIDQACGLFSPSEVGYAEEIPNVWAKVAKETCGYARESP